MHNISPFEALLMTHFVFDWWVLTAWKTFHKENDLKGLIINSGIYTLGFAIAFSFFQIKIGWLLLIFLSHIVLNRNSFFKTAKQSENTNSENVHGINSALIVDQILQIFVLFAIVLLK